MSDTWQRGDLGGGGLQSANLRLARLLRRRHIAYALLLLFPLGLHRNYLHDARGAWCYRAAALLVVASAWLWTIALPVGGAIVLAAAVIDAVRMDDTIARVNKRIRIDVYLSQTGGAPADFRGRYLDAMPDRAGATHTNAPPDSAKPRVPGFAEQERLLREITARKPPGDR